MSLFGDIANTFSSVVETAADVVGGAAQGAAGILGDAAQGAAKLADGALGGLGGLAQMALCVAFPPAAVATSLGNLVTSMVGQAVNSAMQTLCQTAGMPKFIADTIGDLVKDVVGQLTQPSHSGCDEAVKQDCGGAIQDFGKDLATTLVDHIKDAIEDCGGKKGGKASSGSWLEAIAVAMGKALGDRASKMVELSNKMAAGYEGSDSEKAQQAQADNAKFAAVSQEFNIMSNAFNNALKGIGEGSATLARKG
jgi:hypothetical protein